MNETVDRNLKKPGSLLVFLALAEKLGRFMQRKDIVAFIASAYEVEINERTVTQATNYLRVLSQRGQIPYSLQCAGKKGYCLRLEDGSLTLSDCRYLLSSMGELSLSASQGVIKRVAALLPSDDSTLLSLIYEHYLWSNNSEKTKAKIDTTFT